PQLGVERDVRSGKRLGPRRTQNDGVQFVGGNASTLQAVVDGATGLASWQSCPLPSQEPFFLHRGNDLITMHETGGTVVRGRDAKNPWLGMTHDQSFLCGTSEPAPARAPRACLISSL